MNLAGVRQRGDAWDQTADKILAEIVLNNIRTGGTQLAAFNEAAERLTRTKAACGFRWNGVVRKNYRAEIEHAKQSRKAQRQQRTQQSGIEPITVTASSAMQDAIGFLRNFEAEYERLQREKEQLRHERDELQTRVRVLESQTDIAHSEPRAPITPEQLEKDSRTLMEIMNRARQRLQG